MALVLYLARHGETDDNRRRVFQGQGGSGLNRLGLVQAGRLAERVRGLGLAKIISSDLERAAQTATIVGQACGLVPELDPIFREVDVGTWTGRGYTEIQELYREEWAAWTSGLDVRRGGGETYAELAARIETGIERIARDHVDASVLVVSHGGSIKSFIAKLLGVSPQGLAALAGISNTGLTVVERDADGRSRLRVWNDTAHLESLVDDE